MSNDAGGPESGDIELNKADIDDEDLTGTSTSSSDCSEQDDQDTSSSEGSDADNGSQKEKEQSDEESSTSNTDAIEQNSSATRAVTVSSVFSMADALNIIRRKRDEQLRATEEKEEELRAQRLEKARDKRRRRRRNQKQRKALLKSKEGVNSEPSQDIISAAQPDGIPTESILNAPGAGCSERTGVRTILEASNGLKRSANSEVEEDTDAMLKRLPVKKRIKLESKEFFSAQTQAVDHTTNHSDSESLPGGSRQIASGTSGHEEGTEMGPSRVVPISRLIPRALLVKMSQSKRQT